MGDLDNSIVVVEGRTVKGTDIKIAEKAIDTIIAEIANNPVSERELSKVKQKVESALAFGDMNIANKALHLCYYEMLGDVNLINKQNQKYSEVTADQIQAVASKIFTDNNTSVLYYLSNTK